MCGENICSLYFCSWFILQLRTHGCLPSISASTAFSQPFNSWDHGAGMFHMLPDFYKWKSCTSPSKHGCGRRMLNTTPTWGRGVATECVNMRIVIRLTNGHWSWGCCSDGFCQINIKYRFLAKHSFFAFNSILLTVHDLGIPLYLNIDILLISKWCEVCTVEALTVILLPLYIRVLELIPVPWLLYRFMDIPLWSKTRRRKNIYIITFHLEETDFEWKTKGPENQKDTECSFVKSPVVQTDQVLNSTQVSLRPALLREVKPCPHSLTMKMRAEIKPTGS